MNRRNFFKNATTVIVTTATAGVAAKVVAEPVDKYADTKRYFEEVIKECDRDLTFAELTAFKLSLLSAPKELAAVYVLKFMDSQHITEHNFDFISNDDDLVKHFTKAFKRS